MVSTQLSQDAPGKGILDRFFRLTERGSSVGQEIRGGLVTFFAMSYIIVLNPIILSSAAGDGSFLGGSGAANTEAIASTTALVAGVMTIFMGVVANFPMGMAAGLGINSMIAAQIVVAGPDMTYADAMGLVVIEGIIILILVLTNFRQAVFNAVPRPLRSAIAVGIGMFIALLGFINGGFVSPGEGTPLTLGTGGSFSTWPVVVFIFGMLLAFILMSRNIKGAILISIVASTVLAFGIQAIAKLDVGAWGLTAPEFNGVFSTPDFSPLFHFSLLGSFDKIGVITAIMFVFSLLLADFFDTMGTMVAVGAEAKLLDDQGNPLKTKSILVVDSVAAIAGGVGAISSNTSYVESTAGAAEGSRTGLASVVTGVCFLLATFLAPIVTVVPSQAAAPALVVVGFLMLTQVVEIDWTKWEIAIPAFLTIVVMPFGYSITAGIGVGFVSFVVLQVFLGKVRKIHPLMWFAAALFIVYFTLGPIQDLIAGA